MYRDHSSPTNSRSTFGCPCGSRPPAPTPITDVVISGCEPNPVAWAVRRAAPVGVHSSCSTGPPTVGTPRSRLATAGAGTGSEPCAACTRPPPRAIVETTSRSSPRWARPAETPTMSAMASRAPTSWKCTSSGELSWTAASASASRVKVRIAPSSSTGSSIERMSRQVRWLGLDTPPRSSAALDQREVSTWTRVAAMPARSTFSTRSRTGSGLTRSTASWSTSSGTPAPTRAPSSMSPDAPLLASTQPITRHAPRVAGSGGRPGRRTRRRRTRCRC